MLKKTPDPKDSILPARHVQYTCRSTIHTWAGSRTSRTAVAAPNKTSVANSQQRGQVLQRDWKPLAALAESSAIAAGLSGASGVTPAARDSLGSGTRLLDVEFTESSVVAVEQSPG